MGLFDKIHIDLEKLNVIQNKSIEDLEKFIKSINTMIVKLSDQKDLSDYPDIMKIKNNLKIFVVDLQKTSISNFINGFFSIKIPDIFKLYDEIFKAEWIEPLVFLDSLDKTDLQKFENAIKRYLKYLNSVKKIIGLQIEINREMIEMIN